MNETGEFSFILRPSEYGIGVFATHDIRAGTLLKLWGKGNEDGRKLKQSEVPPRFHKFCLLRDGEFIGPADFGHVAVGWYLNHSHSPNAEHRDYDYYARVFIPADSEITIDYNTLDEPEEMKEEYYRRG